MHQTTPYASQPKVGATRTECGHMACAGHQTCRYLPGTYSIRVDYCARDTCWHCNPEGATP